VSTSLKMLLGVAVVLVVVVVVVVVSDDRGIFFFSIIQVFDCLVAAVRKSDSGVLFVSVGVVLLLLLLVVVVVVVVKDVYRLLDIQGIVISTIPVLSVAFLVDFAVMVALLVSTGGGGGAASCCKRKNWRCKKRSSVSRDSRSVSAGIFSATFPSPFLVVADAVGNAEGEGPGEGNLVVVGAL
jgi:hypothetical protein